EGVPASRHLVEDNAQAKDVRTMVDLFPLRLFGGQVRDSAENHSGLSEKRGRESFFFRREALRRVEQKNLGETKVKDFEPTARSDHNIGEFQISMDDSLSVGGAHCIEQLQSEIDEEFLGYAPLRHNRIESFPLQQLHRDKVGFRFLFNRVDCDDVGM